MTSLIVAIDLGATHIRAAEAEIKNGKPPKIKKFHSIPLEADIVSAGEIANEEALSKILKQLWDEAKFKSKFVVAMASGDSMDTRILNDLPWSPPEDFKRLLPHYVKETMLLDNDIEEYYLDSHTLFEYFKLPPNAPEDAQPALYKTILATAVKKTYADSLIRAIEGAGLRPYRLDISSLALIRATANSDIPENASVVSIEIGGDVVTIVVHRNLQPLYLHTAPLLGGIRITQEIAKSLGISTVAAELLKTSFSVPTEMRQQMKTVFVSNDGVAKEITYNDFTAAQKDAAQNIIAREVTNLITHIGDIIEDAFSVSNDAPFRVILSGGGAGLTTLLGRLQNELGVPTVVIQPFENYTESRIPDDVLMNQHIYAALFGLLVGQDEVK